MIICGVDEAGRGPLAGNVVAAAVILDPSHPIIGLNDSKKLSETKREYLYQQIITHAKCYAIAEASVAEIDSINILQASLLAMSRAIDKLTIKPDKAMIDGNKIPKSDVVCEAIIGGDALIAEISAASILAKVTRDRQLIELDKEYPQYGFAKHKGYGTKEHLQAIEQHGIIHGIHRTSFAPIKQQLLF
ncbi:ribonuclease HII [Aquella oligotrophica]|uniref:Ribonuclease HII n=2 Tax=Aquella oligotrophica TaxID=2067065 RepID=A0A2I7N9Q0_9NEIS|nr:ribonuclease HII [Aquella oligotrophica]